MRRTLPGRHVFATHTHLQSAAEDRRRLFTRLLGSRTRLRGVRRGSRRWFVVGDRFDRLGCFVFDERAHRHRPRRACRTGRMPTAGRHNAELIRAVGVVVGGGRDVRSRPAGPILRPCIGACQCKHHGQATQNPCASRPETVHRKSPRGRELFAPRRPKAGIGFDNVTIGSFATRTFVKIVNIGKVFPDSQRTHRSWGCPEYLRPCAAQAERGRASLRGPCWRG